MIRRFLKGLKGRGNLPIVPIIGSSINSLVPAVPCARKVKRRPVSTFLVATYYLLLGGPTISYLVAPGFPYSVTPIL